MRFERTHWRGSIGTATIFHGLQFWRSHSCISGRRNRLPWQDAQEGKVMSREWGEECIITLPTMYYCHMVYSSNPKPSLNSKRVRDSLFLQVSVHFVLLKVILPHNCTLRLTDSGVHVLEPLESEDRWDPCHLKMAHFGLDPKPTLTWLAWPPLLYIILKPACLSP